MNVLNNDWLFSGPVDYEYKKYKLLSALKRYGSLIKDDELYDVLCEIEDNLEELYKYKYQKDILDDRLKVLTGIDLDNMQLMYEYPDNSEELQIIDKLCDEGIEMLEKLYKFLREKWRTNSKFISFTAIPSKKFSWQAAMIYIIDADKTVKVYDFIKPFVLEDDWKKMNLEFIEEYEYDISKLSDAVTNVTVIRPTTQCIRVDVKKILPYDNCTLPLIKHNLFNAIRKGDI